jgi:hypothetical protein
MPPQQAYGLLDFVNQRLDFRAHGQIVPSISHSKMEREQKLALRAILFRSASHQSKALYLYARRRKSLSSAADHN